MEHLNYWEKLKLLHFYSQERRRERYQLIFLWKICQGLVQGYSIEFYNDEGRTDRMLSHFESWESDSGDQYSFDVAEKSCSVSHQVAC